MAADPFEVRVKFSSMLQKLPASSGPMTKAALFFLKHPDQHEDLHSCIVENVEESSKNNMNTRANIMYFLETLCLKSREGGHTEPIGMMQRDIKKIVDGVAPADGSGAANVKVVRKVVSELAQKDFLSADAATELNERLKNRDAGQSPSEESRPKHRVPAGGSSKRRAVETRIEEDRERHKRMREGLWAVSSENNGEMERLWDDASEIDEDDYTDAQDDLAERHRAAVAAG